MVSLVKNIRSESLFKLIYLFFFLSSVQISYAQSDMVFSITEFIYDQSDHDARREPNRKVDNNGVLYAIIKISSNNPDDRLSEYYFNFGIYNCMQINKSGELWVYVQKDAKQVTIRRSGYKTIKSYDLGYTLEPGAVYRLKISAQKEIQKGGLIFQITPAIAGVKITYSNKDGVESYCTSDAYGRAIKYLELGIYSYSVLLDGYHKYYGQVKLEYMDEKYIEDVVLKPTFAEVELMCENDADIYVDNQNKGTSYWAGTLSPGSYKIEARKKNHKSSFKRVELKEGEKYKFLLEDPTPIVGTLVLMSSPLGANVKIDNIECGVTPLTLDNVIIGSHRIELTKNKYYSQTKTIQINEGDIIHENIELEPSDLELKKQKEAEINALKQAEKIAQEIEKARLEKEAKAEQKKIKLEENKKKYSKQVVGFSSIINLLYTIKIGHDYLGLDYVGGYRFDNKNFLGVGTGIRLAYSPEKKVLNTSSEGAYLPGNSYSIPVYVHYRLNFLNSRFSPYFGLSAGANFSAPAEVEIYLCAIKYTTIGGFLNPQLGLNYRITPKSSIYVAVGLNIYTMSKCIDNTGYNATFKHSLYYSGDFHLGITF